MNSMKDRVGERFDPTTAGVTRFFKGEQKAVHAAAKTSLASMGFRVVRSGAAQGIIEAVSGLESDSSLRSSRQLRVKIFIDDIGAFTQVRASISEILEDSFNKGSALATEVPILNTPYYDIFFRGIEKQITPQEAPVSPSSP